MNAEDKMYSNCAENCMSCAFYPCHGTVWIIFYYYLYVFIFIYSFQTLLTSQNQIMFLDTLISLQL